MRKPSGCTGCPFEHFGTEYVPDEVRANAPLLVMGQNPGSEEEAQGRPFVGKTGAEMERKYFADAGITRDMTSIGNAIRCRVRGSNDLPPVSQTIVRDAMRHCHNTHFTRPEGVKLIVSQGDYASVLLTGSTITDGDRSTGWRGYLKPWLDEPPRVHDEPWVPVPRDVPVLVTVHLARLFREPVLTLPTRMDWAKVPRILRGTWPRTPPRFLESSPSVWPSTFAFDTEFYGSDPYQTLVRYSLAWGVNDGECMVVEVGQHSTPRREGTPRVITQYAPADMRHLASLYRGGNLWGDFLIEDSVWKHAVLWSDHPHDLNYLGSVYGSFNRWKHLSERAPRLYSALDAIGLLEVDRALEGELNADPRSRKVWEDIDRPAIGEFVRAQYHGIRTDPRRVEGVVRQLQAELGKAQSQARALVGWPLNLGSNPQVAKELYERENVKVPR